MAIGATYKSPQSGLLLKHISGEVVFRRIGKGIVEVYLNNTYKLEGEQAFSYKQPAYKWVKMSEANVIMEKLFTDVELALGLLVDLSPAETPLETPEIPHPVSPCTVEARPGEASGPQNCAQDSDSSACDSSHVDGAKLPSAEGTQ